MRKIGFVALGMAAALAGCSKPTPGHGNAASGGAMANGSAANGAGSNVSGANGAAANGATAAASAAGGGTATMASALNPGEWETAIEMKMTGLPANMPPEAAKAMQGMKTVTRHCLTPEKAAKPTGDLFSGKPAQGCSNREFSVSGGRLHGQISCKSPQGTNSTMTMDGQYGGDSFDVTMTMTGEQGGRSMTWQSHSVGHRVAPTCSAAAKDD